MIFNSKVTTIGKEMALAVNGGCWEKDYTEFQKIGWYLKAKWVLEKYV